MAVNLLFDFVIIKQNSRLQHFLFFEDNFNILLLIAIAILIDAIPNFS